ncbi:hypothetical protein [Methylobacterium pseudosasicola]|uniref:Uncharacterized protein n=1 Tax=Methylobacterium pseudosasicola TaxID=582667 RepID=A0A1I4KSZ8_9HYPH|nr:hypothetical protein [Methylobacterium pseudosasicola]SFL81914.1 hypothetical protein SAMN05192568_1011125 [Methylobacterium pseudosasicola]
MTFRVLAILVTLCGMAALGIALLDEPDRLWVFLGKLGEGGMWTALAIFVGIAAVLGYRRRDAAGRRR